MAPVAVPLLQVKVADAAPELAVNVSEVAVQVSTTGLEILALG